DQSAVLFQDRGDPRCDCGRLARLGHRSRGRCGDAGSSRPGAGRDGARAYGVSSSPPDGCSPTPIAGSWSASDGRFMERLELLAHGLATTLAALPLSQFIQDQHAYTFATLETLDLIGLSLLIGTIGAFDIRVLGLASAIPRGPCTALFRG